MRNWVSGLKVVTGKGEKLHLNKSLVKNATGYDLKNLFVGSEGTLGFVLNKPIDMKINELMADFPEFDCPVYFGGPVATDTIHFMHNVGDLLRSIELELGMAA
mgnify:CR=1 FL=1